MINNSIVNFLESLGIGSDIDALESYVAKAQDAHSLGKSIISDAEYDALVRVLRELKPNSSVLNRNWEIYDFELDQYDVLLHIYPMRSIQTIADMKELKKFKVLLAGIGSVEVLASQKLNGHAVRIVYNNGALVRATTRGRRKKGRDITRHLSHIVPTYIEDWVDLGMVEVRGEVLVSHDNFELVKHYLKTPLSAVTSMLRESVSDEELQLLSCVCYKILHEDIDTFETLSDEMNELMDKGFEVPYRVRVDNVNSNNLERVVTALLKRFEEKEEEESIYATDGIVVAINDNYIFRSLGVDERLLEYCKKNDIEFLNQNLGNFALKMGKWESNIYSSEIEEIIWVPGKQYIVPKAKIRPVAASSGAVISTVPLYNVGVMERYMLIPGSEIYFRFGGEQGVTLTDSNGMSIRYRG